MNDNRKHYFRTFASLPTAFNEQEFNFLKANADLMVDNLRRLYDNTHLRSRAVAEGLYDQLERFLPNLVNKVLGIMCSVYVLDTRKTQGKDLPLLYVYYENQLDGAEAGGDEKIYTKSDDGSRLLLVDNDAGTDEIDEKNAEFVFYHYRQAGVWWFYRPFLVFLDYLRGCEDYSYFQKHLMSGFTSKFSIIPHGHEETKALFLKNETPKLAPFWQEKYDEFLASLK